MHSNGTGDSSHRYALDAASEQATAAFAKALAGLMEKTLG